MTKKRIVFYLFTSLLIFEALYISKIPNVKANGTIPALYSQDLDLNATYTYNVTQFDSVVNWLDVDGGGRGAAISNPGGQITVNVSSFYNKKPGASYSSCFDDPIPHLNISFFENISDILVLNTTFSNISNTETGYNLAMGFNKFHSGFIIQANNLAAVKVKAQEQALTWPGDLTITDYDSMIKFAVLQSIGNQNSTMIYDKTNGTLVYCKVHSDSGLDFEINMTAYNFDFTITPSTENPPQNPLITGFPLILVFTIIGITLVISLLKEKKKYK